MNRKQPSHQPTESISDVKHVLVWNRPKPTLSELRQTETLPYVNRYFEKKWHTAETVCYLRSSTLETVLLRMFFSRLCFLISSFSRLISSNRSLYWISPLFMMDCWILIFSYSNARASFLFINCIPRRSRSFLTLKTSTEIHNQYTTVDKGNILSHWLCIKAGSFVTFLLFLYQLVPEVLVLLTPLQASVRKPSEVLSPLTELRRYIIEIKGRPVFSAKIWWLSSVSLFRIIAKNFMQHDKCCEGLGKCLIKNFYLEVLL